MEHNTNSWKTVINAAGSSETDIGGFKVAPPGTLVSNSAVVFSVESNAAATNLGNLLRSKLYKFIIAQVKHSRYNSKGNFEKLPNLDLTRSWTDEELYAHFNLTEEEIKLIEDTIK